MAKGIEVASYDPKKVNVIVGGRTITGFAADGVVSVTKNEDSITPAVGAKDYRDSLKEKVAESNAQLV